MGTIFLRSDSEKWGQGLKWGQSESRDNMLFHDTNLVNYKKLKHIHTSLVFSMNTVHSTCILLISNIYNAFFDKITYCQVGRSIFYFLLDLKRALG